jgi:benzoyl-CoA reductase subunit D
MLVAGIDAGARALKIVVLEDGQAAGQALVPTGADPLAALEQAWSQVAAPRARIQALALTGSAAPALAALEGLGAQVIQVSPEAAAARAAQALAPQARTVIEAGGEESRVLKLDAAGQLADSALNEKCAAGAGIFAESMARALEVDLEQMGPLSLQATGKVGINAQCMVFAESEVVALLHANTPKADLARAIHQAMAERVASLVQRLGLTEPALLLGGLARNAGFVDCLGKLLNTQLSLPEKPQMASALGAALLAAQAPA